MKKILCTLLFTYIVIVAFAQVPNRISYQAVVRNSNNALVVDQVVGVKITILKGSLAGTAVFSEIHQPKTNTNGLISFEIGGGSSQVGDFSSINWADDLYFIKTEIDPSGGVSYIITGTSQLLSVPYAMHAKTASNIANHYDGDTSASNELQTLKISNDTIYLTNGGFVKLPDNKSASVPMPTVSTGLISVGTNNITFNGYVSKSNGSVIIEKGIVYANHSKPNIHDPGRIYADQDTGVIVKTYTNDFREGGFIKPNTVYYARTYATTENNITAYGNEVQFTSANPTPATITTNPVTKITALSAQFNGAVVNKNGNNIVYQGFIISTSTTPNADLDLIVNGPSSPGLMICRTESDTNIFNINYATSSWSPYWSILGGYLELMPNTQYRVRSFCLAANGSVSNGNEVTFSTLNMYAFSPIKVTSNSVKITGSVVNADSCMILEHRLYVSLTPNFDSAISLANTPLQSCYAAINLATGSFDLESNKTYYAWVNTHLNSNNRWVLSSMVNFTSLSVGQTGPAGGKVFYDKGDTIGGWRYLEAAPTDQSAGIQWGCQGTDLSTSEDFGFGETNTNIITNGCNDASFAAKLCYNLVLGGQSNWFLPSLGEINLMYRNLHLKSLGNFSLSNDYWSSSQSDGYGAWGFNFTFNNNNSATGAGYFGSPLSRQATKRVRAIRAY